MAWVSSGVFQFCIIPNEGFRSGGVLAPSPWVEQGVSADKAFPMADVKVLYNNKLLLDRFISILPKGIEMNKNDPKVRELYTFGCKAA